MSEEFVPASYPERPLQWRSDPVISNYLDSLEDTVNRTRMRTGGEVDLVNDAQTQLATITTTITNLSDAVEEIEELIVLLQKRVKTMVYTLENKLNCLEEKIETD